SSDESDEGSEDSDSSASSDSQMQEFQCALRCWQCGVRKNENEAPKIRGNEDETGEIISVPTSHEATRVIESIMDAVRRNLDTVVARSHIEYNPDLQ
ncbi:hypothetical protein FRC18_010523, partial [Serendipita sp. 400]